jgi:hypothetical protein
MFERNESLGLNRHRAFSLRFNEDADESDAAVDAEFADNVERLPDGQPLYLPEELEDFDLCVLEAGE